MMRRLSAPALAMLLGMGSAAPGATPDFTGVWQLSGPARPLRADDGKAPPLNKAGLARYARIKDAMATNIRSIDPVAICKPPGNPRIFLQDMPFEIVQTKDQLTMFHRWNHQISWITIGGEPSPDTFPAYYGQSVGRWAGETLDIAVDALNDLTFLDNSGLPHSDKLTLRQQFRLVEGGKQLEARITITDPVLYSRPWQTVLRFDRLPVRHIHDEDVCEDRTPGLENIY